MFKTEEEKLNVYKIVAVLITGHTIRRKPFLSQKIVKIARKMYPKNSPEQIEAYDMLAYISLAAGECEDALKLAAELKRYYTGKFGRG